MENYNLYSDDKLVGLLLEGDKFAYTEIYRRYEGPLYVFIYRRLPNKEDTRDIVHELFLYLWERRGELHITQGLLPYLYTAAKNKILNRIKHDKVSERYLDAFQSYIEQATENTDYAVRQKEIIEIIEREIAALPPKMRKVFELSRKTNYTRKQIADELGLSEATVKSHMHHALKLLKSKLGDLFFMVFI